MGLTIKEVLDYTDDLLGNNTSPILENHDGDKFFSYNDGLSKFKIIQHYHLLSSNTFSIVIDGANDSTHNYDFHTERELKAILSYNDISKPASIEEIKSDIKWLIDTENVDWDFIVDIAQIAKKLQDGKGD